MRLPKRHGLAALGFPSFSESAIKIAVEFARGIVRNIEQRWLSRSTFCNPN
jgi:hypothetical protein